MRVKKILPTTRPRETGRGPGGLGGEDWRLWKRRLRRRAPQRHQHRRDKAPCTTPPERTRRPPRAMRGVAKVGRARSRAPGTGACRGRRGEGGVKGWWLLLWLRLWRRRREPRVAEARWRSCCGSEREPASSWRFSWRYCCASGWATPRRHWRRAPKKESAACGRLGALEASARRRFCVWQREGGGASARALPAD